MRLGRALRGGLLNTQRAWQRLWVIYPKDNVHLIGSGRSYCTDRSIRYPSKVHQGSDGGEDGGILALVRIEKGEHYEWTWECR